MSQMPVPSATDSFRLIEALLPTLPEQAVRQFRDALGARLAMPTPAQQRRDRLGTILDFLRSHGRPPTASEYVEHHDARHANGVPSIPLSTLCEHYNNSYSEAVNVAVRLYTRGTAARAPSRKPLHRSKTYWTEERCLQASENCMNQIGHWPGVRDFAALRTAGTKLAEANGWHGLELQADTVIERLFGSYGEMIVAAQRAVEQRREANRSAADTTEPSPASRKGRTTTRRPRSTRITVDS